MLEYEHDDEPKPSMSQEAMQELNKMRLDNTLCDAVLQVDGAVRFNVHRNILSACSHFFRAWFTSPLNDVSQEFNIVGIRAEIMEEVINYAYLRSCKITDQTVHELYVVADYTATLGLLRKCVQHMIQMLNPENCVGLMLFARERFSDELYGKARYFLLRNFVDVAQRSRELFQITVNDFVHIISDDLLNVKSEEIVWTACIKWIDQDPPDRKKEVASLLRACRLGLLNSQYFMEQVKEQKYVVECEETRALVIEALTFLYDLDMISMHDEVEVVTPAMAVPRLPHEVIFAIGGWSEGMPQRFIETYDTRADRWIRVFAEDPVGPRAYHGTAVIGHKLYCIGGFDGVEYYNTCRCFDAVNRNWSEIAPMHARRCYVSVAVMQGKIYALGGYDGHNRQNTAERYDPRTNQWTMITPMNSLRSDADACCLEDKVYITGGFNGQECLNTAECYDDTTGTWTQLPHMLSRRSGVSCVAHNGRVYVIGGFNGLARLQSGEFYTPTDRRWNPIREMYSPRSNFGLEIIDDMIFAIGGFNGLATISQTECYVPETNEWLEATDMGIIRSALTANVVAGLPNVSEYIHKDRDRIMEDRRLRILHQQSGDSLEHLGADEDLIEVD